MTREVEELEGEPNQRLLPICPVLSVPLPMPGPPGDGGLKQHSPRLLWLHAPCVQQMLSLTPSISHEGLCVSTGSPEIEGGYPGRSKRGLLLAAFAIVNPLPSVFILLTHCFHLGWQFFCCWLQSLTVYRGLRWMEN